MSLHHLDFGPMHSPPLLQQPAHCAPPWSPSSSSFAPSSTEDGIDDADDDELTGSVVADPSYADDDDDDDDGDDDEQDGDLHPALDELPQDSKDVLVERLTDLAQRLSATGRGPGRGALQPGDISALHARVDDIEDVLRAAGQQTTRNKAGGKGTPPPRGGTRTRGHVGLGVGDLPSSPARTPPLLMTRPSDGILRTQSDDPRDARTRGGGGVSAATVATEVASQIRVEADKLDRELMAVLSSLQARREEADHLHDMLLDRANGAAKRILALEQEIAELKEEIAGNEADLRNLGLQLKAIEAVCDTVASDVDQDLLRSIRDWKSDWANLKTRMSSQKAHRRGHHGLEHVNMSTIAS